MPVSSLQAAILSLVTTVTSIVVGFGIINNTTAGIVVSVAGTAVAAVFQVANELHRKTEAAPAVPARR